MNRLFKRKSFFVSLLAFALLAAYQRYAPPLPTQSPQQSVTEQKQEVIGAKTSQSDGMVTKVADGDTITVTVAGEKQKIRIIGINTPESVDPRRGVQCFGKEASVYAKSVLLGKIVRLESDPSQTDHDKYGRSLRYVWLGAMDFGKHMIEQGYAHEYTYDIPYLYQESYKTAEQLAQQQQKGLWADTTCAQESQ